MTACAWLVAGSTYAHTTATGLATLDVRSDRPSYRLVLTPSELGAPLDDAVRGAAGDMASAARAVGWLHALVGVAVDGRACRVERTRLQASQSGDERLLLLLDFACHATPGVLTVNDRLSTSLGPHYRTIVSVMRPDGAREERIIDADHMVAQFDLGRAAPSSWLGFLRLGIEHIASGFDHLLFLAALLMGSRRIKDLLLTITAFTLAHSVSLALSVLGLVAVSPAWVEPAIAASIVWVAAENLVGEHPSWRRYLLAFVFGLVHGLGFAEALTGLHLPRESLVSALIGFNLGVEVAQAAAVLALAPLLGWRARRPSARRWERAVSALIAIIGLAWFTQRVSPTLWAGGDLIPTTRCHQTQSVA